MRETCIAQPANFLLQVGLAAVFKDLGVEPAAIVGHSVGEVAAAHVAGALDLADAVRVVYHRSRLQQTTAGTGTMLAVGLGVADVGPWVKGHESAVSIGAVNSARSVTLAGDETVLKLIAEELAEAGVFHRFLKVEVPYHSPMMEPLHDELLASLDGLRCRAPTVPLISTVTGRRFTEADRHDGAYWFRNLRDPVLFADALDALIDEGYGLFAEIGPNPVLSSAIRDGLADRHAAGDIVYSLRRKDPESPRILATIAELYTLGLPPDWRRINGEADRDIDLPTYHWGSRYVLVRERGGASRPARCPGPSAPRRPGAPRHGCDLDGRAQRQLPALARRSPDRRVDDLPRCRLRRGPAWRSTPKPKTPSPPSSNTSTSSRP